MPLLPWMPFITQGAASIWNAFTQGKTNRQQRQYESGMYERQRQDAIEDFNRQWSLETQYNSPTATMQRYKDAGLNPNLVYGSNQVYNPPAVRSSSAGQWNPKAPQIDGSALGSTFMDIYDARLKEVQTDNVKASTEVAQMEAWLKSLTGGNVIADTENKIADLKRKGVDTESAQLALDQARKMMPINLEQASVNVEKGKADIASTLASAERTGVETKLSIDRNEREIMLNAVNVAGGKMNIAKAAEEILNYRLGRAKTTGEMQELGLKINRLKQEIASGAFDLRLQRMGIKGTYGDVARVIGMLISSSNWGEFIKALGSGGKQGPTPMDK